MRVLLVAFKFSSESHTLKKRTRLFKDCAKAINFLALSRLLRIASSVFLRNHLMTFLVPLYFLLYFSVNA